MDEINSINPESEEVDIQDFAIITIQFPGRARKITELIFVGEPAADGLQSQRADLDGQSIRLSSRTYNIVPKHLVGDIRKWKRKISSYTHR